MDVEACPEEEINEDFEDSDVTVICDGPIPVIDFSDQLEQKLAKKWKRSVIIQLLGQRLGYMAMSVRLHSLWNIDNVKLLDLRNNFFLVQFHSDEDNYIVMLEGPWVVSGAYVFVQSWSPSFDVN